MKKAAVIFLMLLCLFLLPACSSGQAEKTFFSMDTTVTLKAYGNGEKIEEAIKLAEKTVKNLDSVFSIGIDTSDTVKFNSGATLNTLSDYFVDLYNISELLNEKTENNFSHKIGSVIDLWQSGSETNSVPTQNDITKALAENNINFGAIAKGYACTKAIEQLKNAGADSGIVSFVSSVGVFGQKPDNTPWKIAIRSPYDTTEILGYVTLDNEYLSVSGDYERYYTINGEKYNHIINPETGLPVNNGIHSCIVVATDGETCDALSTAFFVAGIDKTKEMISEFENIGVIIISDDETYMNEKMKGIFTYKQ